jgi:amino acid transporter
VIILVAQFGAAFTGQAGAARLLFGMARDNVLPASLFGRLKSRRNLPVQNIVFTGILFTAGAMVFDFERGAEVLNFGAFLALLGVNLAVIRTFYFRAATSGRRLVRDLLLPFSGFAFCLAIWLALPRAAH